MSVSDHTCKQWHHHGGPVVSSANGFDVVDCEACGFKHVLPIPTAEELESAYRHEYYTQEKPLYIERYREDLPWWNTVYTRRYELLERFLPQAQRSMLDIGSGPGFFLLNGQQRGWRVKGVEPSIEAAVHTQKMGLDVENIFFTEQSAPGLGTFDAINMGEVLEHIPAPANMLKLVHASLNANGVVCIVVPNDFNPFQHTLESHQGFKPWWVAPPHHINYFNFKSLARLLVSCGFEVVHEESTFPIDLFLLMGDNYVGNDALGRACHTRRMSFEKAMVESGQGDVLTGMYTSFASQGLGREVVMFARAVHP
jgi:SAM-dependent methyltransferase